MNPVSKRQSLTAGALVALLIALPAVGSAVTYEYDALQRVTRVTYDDANSIYYTYDAAGNVIAVGPYAGVGVPGVDAGPVLRLAIEGVHPNPSVGGFGVALALLGTAPARLEVFDVMGRRMKAVDLGPAMTGRRVVNFDGAQRLSPGVYLLRLTEAQRRVTARAVVLR